MSLYVDDWAGSKSKKWNTNRKHYADTYNSDALVLSSQVSVPLLVRPSKKLIDVPKTGKEIIEKSSIRIYPETKVMGISQEADYKFGKRVDEFHPAPRPRRPERL